MSITVIVVSLALITYRVLPFGLISIVKGCCPVGIVAMTVCVAVLMTETVQPIHLDQDVYSKRQIPVGVAYAETGSRFFICLSR
jgi:hypothetical protein